MFGISHGPHLYQVPLRTPYTIRIVEPEFRATVPERYLSDRAVVFRIRSVDVAAYTPAEQGMIKPRIELYLVLPGLTLDLDPAEIAFPGPQGILLDPVERKRSGLLLQVQPGILHRSIGYSHLDRHRLVLHRFEFKAKTCPGTRSLVHSFYGIRTVESPYLRSLLVQGSGKINRDLGPGLIFLHILGQRDHPSFDGSVGKEFHGGVLHGPALTHPAADIEDYTAVRILGESEPVICNTLGSSHFRLDSIFLQQYRIISRPYHLLIVTENGTVALRTSAVRASGNRHRMFPASGRHQGDSPDLELMDGRKTLDGVVTIVITRCLPAILVAEVAVGRRSRLRHTERQGPGGEMEVPAVGSPYPGLYIIDHTLTPRPCLRKTWQEGHDHEQN